MAASSTVLSETERQFILGGVEDDIRSDGRGCRHVRHFVLKRGVVSNTSGSAMIERGKTSAIIGVKAELGEPHPSTPDQGRLEFHVDCSALASPLFQRYSGEVIGQRLAEQLEEAYNSNPSCVDCKALSVIPEQQCWIIYVDALMLEVGGNVLDTLSIGVLAALQSTLIPKLTVTGEGEEMEIEVSDNPHNSKAISAEGAPVIMTINQIGSKYVLDCTSEEELCSSCQLSLAIDKDGRVLSTVMEGEGAIPYNIIPSIISMAVEGAEEVFEAIAGSSTDNEQDSTTSIFNHH